jgi:hypothetical protein
LIYPLGERSEETPKGDTDIDESDPAEIVVSFARTGSKKNA